MTSAHHCGNCPNPKCEYPNDIVYCYNLDENINTELIKVAGCLSHPLAQAALREEGAKQEREQMLCLSDKDKERIAAAMAIATFCSGIPEVFDTIQLNCNAPNETAASYAKAMLVILDNTSEWCDLIDRLSTYTNGNISLRQSQSTGQQMEQDNRARTNLVYLPCCYGEYDECNDPAGCIHAANCQRESQSTGGNCVKESDKT